MKPDKELEILYKNSIAQAKKTFQEHFTCRLKIAPHNEEYEVAVIPIVYTPKNTSDIERFNNIQVCLLQLPAIFMTVNLRKGDRNVLRIRTRSGGVRELWEIVHPIVDLVIAGDIGFKSYDEITEAETA